MKRKLNLDHAVRKNKGLQLKDKWIAKLQETGDIKILPEDILTIAETDRLKKSFFERIKNGNDVEHKNWSYVQISDQVSFLRVLGINLKNISVIVFSSADKYIGAIRLPMVYVFTHLDEIWDVVGEDLCVTTDDLISGFCFEFNFYTESGEYVKEGVYKSSVWGEFK